MRHGMTNRKLGRTSAHRAALFRNQLASMIDKERIITTLPKAKELRPIVEKMITLGKEDSVHRRRQAARSVADDQLVRKLFESLSPRFTDRPGGYTRIIKLGPRRGDGAEMAILEFVDYEMKPAETATPEEKPRKKSAKAEGEGEEAEAGEEKEKKAKPAKAKAKREAKPKRSAAPKATKGKKGSTKSTASRKGSSRTKGS